MAHKFELKAFSLKEVFKLKILLLNWVAMKQIFNALPRKALKFHSQAFPPQAAFKRGIIIFIPSIKGLLTAFLNVPCFYKTAPWQILIPDPFSCVSTENFFLPFSGMKFMVELHI